MYYIRLIPKQVLIIRYHSLSRSYGCTIRFDQRPICVALPVLFPMLAGPYKHAPILCLSQHQSIGQVFTTSSFITFPCSLTHTFLGYSPCPAYPKYSRENNFKSDYTAEVGLVLQAIDVDPDFGAALKQQAFLLRLLSSFVTLDRPLDPAAPRLPVFVKTTHGKRRAGG